MNTTQILLTAGFVLVTLGIAASTRSAQYKEQAGSMHLDGINSRARMNLKAGEWLNWAGLLFVFGGIVTLGGVARAIIQAFV